MTEKRKVPKRFTEKDPFQRLSEKKTQTGPEIFYIDLKNSKVLQKKYYETKIGENYQLIS